MHSFVQEVAILPWHSLHKPLAEVIVGNCDLHLLVSHIGVTVAQEHNLFQQ